MHADDSRCLGDGGDARLPATVLNEAARGSGSSLTRHTPGATGRSQFAQHKIVDDHAGADLIHLRGQLRKYCGSRRQKSCGASKASSPRGNCALSAP
jgi:hypothetical protein